MPFIIHSRLGVMIEPNFTTATHHYHHYCTSSARRVLPRREVAESPKHWSLQTICLEACNLNDQGYQEIYLESKVYLLSLHYIEFQAEEKLIFIYCMHAYIRYMHYIINYSITIGDNTT